MRRYVAELVGTFFLVLTVVTVVSTGSPLAPVAVGGVLTAMVFATGHLSGAHLNPAVTLAVLLRGRIAAADVPGYLVAQVLGAVAGAGVGRFVAGGPAGPALALSGDRLAAAFVAELAVTTALAYVVLNVATSSDHADNQFYGLAIGVTVTAGAVAVGPVSGGVFNPAVAVGAAAAGLLGWSTVWVYLVAGPLAALLAAGLFRAGNAHEWAPSPAGDAAVPAPRPAPAQERSAPASAPVA